jgi:2-keto-3-deoxy-galactonokinase
LTVDGNTSAAGHRLGTSNLRASLLDAAGRALETRSAPGGVMAVEGGRFSAALLGARKHTPLSCHSAASSRLMGRARVR